MDEKRLRAALKEGWGYDGEWVPSCAAQYGMIAHVAFRSSPPPSRGEPDSSIPLSPSGRAGMYMYFSAQS